MTTQALTGVDATHGGAGWRTNALRVCHIISGDLWAGAETQVVAMMAYLAQQPGIELSALLLNEGRLADELRRLDITVIVLDETRTSTLGTMLGLMRTLRDHPCDLVHVHKYKEGVLGTLAARFAGVPLVVRTMHGLAEPFRGWQQLKMRAYMALDRATLQVFGDLVIAVSQRMAETLWESGYRPTMVTCIQNGLDLNRLVTTRQPAEVRCALGVAPDDVLIGTVGRLTLVKGHACLLQAAARILESETRARFLFAGDGELQDELMTTAARLKIDRACLFIGSRRDVYDVVAALDVFVLPSLNEGLPMSLLEAMALGRPVVASDVGGIPEVMQHQVNGLLVPPGDAQQLAVACLQLAFDRDLAARLGARARQTIEAAFTHERSGSALLNVYRGLAARPLRRMVSAS